MLTRWNYLRVRGEYASHGSLFGGYWELPPRTRRIHFPVLGLGEVRGTTSAYAENTRHVVKRTPYFWNYLRVRGEYVDRDRGGVGGGELPPRTRRILARLHLRVATPGTTSAYAENTPRHPRGRSLRRNYLRVRGEYDMFENTIIDIMELPPRTRRIPLLPEIAKAAGGTTSAYAENTPAPWASIWNPWNYLRVRGEYPK